MLIYGAHLLRNGAARILERMMAGGWLTHLATNGAGTIHDWEYAWLGASTESVEKNVATGTFGTWHETATNIHLALMAGALDGLGYGRALGRFILEDGATLPDRRRARRRDRRRARGIRSPPPAPTCCGRCDEQRWPAGRIDVEHRWKHASILAQAYRHGVPMTVHPGIGYDIISNHPVFNGAAIGRAAEWDFKLFGGSLRDLEGGVVLSIGSAIMGPQVFEKALSCVNNLRLQDGPRRRPRPHASTWSTSRTAAAGTGRTASRPRPTRPITCGSARAFPGWAARCNYVQCDNVTFLHHLYRRLSGS